MTPICPDCKTNPVELAFRGWSYKKRCASCQLKIDNRSRNKKKTPEYWRELRKRKNDASKKPPPQSKPQER